MKNLILCFMKSEAKLPAASVAWLHEVFSVREAVQSWRQSWHAPKPTKPLLLFLYLAVILPKDN